MRKGSWMILALLVVGFLAFRLHSVPSIPYPGSADAAGHKLQVMAQMSSPTDGEFWLLSRRSDGRYVVSVWIKQKEVQQFVASKPGPQGRIYATSGPIRVNGTLYEGTSMSISSDGHKGYLTLVPVNTPSPTHSSNTP